MYAYVDHLKCKHCCQTNCLFKLRVNAWEKKKTGNIIYVETSECKVCYLERCRIKNDRWFAKKKNRDKFNANARKTRRGNPHYIEAARRSYRKNRHKILARKRAKYKKTDPHKDKRRKFSLIGTIRNGVW